MVVLLTASVSKYKYIINPNLLFAELSSQLLKCCLGGSRTSSPKRITGPTNALELEAARLPAGQGKHEAVVPRPAPIMYRGEASSIAEVQLTPPRREPPPPPPFSNVRPYPLPEQWADSNYMFGESSGNS